MQRPHFPKESGARIREMVHPEDGPRVGPGHNFPSAAPSLLDNKRRWWPQLRPSLGRRALTCCALRKWRKLLGLLRSITRPLLY